MDVGGGLKVAEKINSVGWNPAEDVLIELYNITFCGILWLSYVDQWCKCFVIVYFNVTFFEQMILHNLKILWM